jgi:dienelactone hydrolase
MKKILRTSVSLFIAVACSLLCFAADNNEYQKTAINSPDRSMPVFYESLKTKMPFALGWKDGSDPAAWKAAGLQKARELMISYDDTAPFDMVVIDKEDRGTYIAEKIVYNMSSDSRCLAYLLVPKGKGKTKNGVFPAALMLHDHGSKFVIGKEKMVKPFGTTDDDKEKLKESDAWAQRFFTGNYPGDELAKRGYVVLSIDAFGWGDRSVAGFKTDSQQALASNLFNMGTSFASIIAQEDVRAAKFLASLPQVDKKRVACVGFSMGAFRSWQLAALSNDITAGVVICWMGTMQGLMVPGNNQLKGQSAFSMLHPYISRYLDYPDVAGLAAPKPMLFYNGGADGLFPLDSVNAAYEKMHKIWTANGADDKLHTEIIPNGQHEFLAPQQQSAYDWLDAQFAAIK